MRNEAFTTRRALRFLALTLLGALFGALVIHQPAPKDSAWAQLQGAAPPPPLSAPPPPPGGEVTPGAIVPGALPPAPGFLPPAGVPLTGPSPVLGALPPLAPAPALLPAPAPAATPRLFRCACFGPGTYSRWMGHVAASSYFTARENAVNQCIAYNFNRRPVNSFMPPPVFEFFPTPQPPLAAVEAEPGLPQLQAPGVSGFSVFSSPARLRVLRLCSECACN